VTTTLNSHCADCGMLCEPASVFHPQIYCRLFKAGFMNPAALLELVRLGARVQEANIGGLHWKEGTRRFLDYMYVTPEDVTALSELARSGVQLTALDLPGNPKVDLVAALADGRLAFDNLSPRHP